MCVLFRTSLPYLIRNCGLLFFETGAYYAAQAGPELAVFLLQPRMCWGYKHALLHLCRVLTLFTLLFTLLPTDTRRLHQAPARGSPWWVLNSLPNMAPVPWRLLQGIDLGALHGALICVWRKWMSFKDVSVSLVPEDVWHMWVYFFPVATDSLTFLIVPDFSLGER